MQDFPDAPTYPIDALSRLHVSQAAVRAALAMVSPNKACGTDNISARIVTECADELVIPLTKICSLSVRSGVFPERWKQANIIPLYKKGDKKIRRITDLSRCFLSSGRYWNALCTANCIGMQRPF